MVGTDTACPNVYQVFQIKRGERKCPHGKKGVSFRVVRRSENDGAETASQDPMRLHLNDKEERE